MCEEWGHLQGQSAVQVAGDGGEHGALGHSVVAGVREARATAAAALTGGHLRCTRPHGYSAATL